MSKIKFKKVLNNRIQIDTDTPHLYNKLRDLYTAENPFAAMSKSPYVPSHIYGISPMANFKLGMFSDVYKDARDIFDSVEVDAEIIKTLMPFKDCLYNEKILPVPNETFIYRDYQLKAITMALKIGRGLILSPTASGKSLIIAGLLHNILSKCRNINTILLLVPNRQLVDQMYGDFIEYGITDVQKYCSGSTGTLISKIIISNRQYLQQVERVKKLPTVDCIFVDECHQVSSGNKVSTYIDKLKTPIRFGCTGTLPKDVWNKWETKGIIGTVLFTEEITNLQEQNYLAKLNLISVKFMYTPKQVKDSGIYFIDKEDTTVSNNKRLREKFDNESHFFIGTPTIAKNVLKLCISVPTNSLILFDSLETGHKLREIMEGSKYENRFRYIDGSIKSEVREGIRAEMESRNDIILAAQTATFSTGINIKNLNNIFFMFTSKSPVKIIQSIGRGLRLKENKSTLNLIDISSNLKYSKKHLKEREKLYDEMYDKTFDHEVKINSLDSVSMDFCIRFIEFLK